MGRGCAAPYRFVLCHVVRCRALLWPTKVRNRWDRCGADMEWILRVHARTHACMHPRTHVPTIHAKRSLDGERGAIEFNNGGAVWSSAHGSYIGSYRYVAMHAAMHGCIIG